MALLSWLREFLLVHCPKIARAYHANSRGNCEDKEIFVAGHNACAVSGKGRSDDLVVIRVPADRIFNFKGRMGGAWGQTNSCLWLEYGLCGDSSHLWKPVTHEGHNFCVPLFLIKELQRRLDAAASEKTKRWWENYLRGVIAFRGVGIPKIREILVSWRYDTGVEDLPLDEQLEIAFALFEESLTEDKLAGTLLLQDYLRSEFHWEDLLPRYAKLYERNLIYDWNTCDWFCVRVLGPTLADNGLSFARALSGWRGKKHLWQARSAAVPFISVAGNPDFYPFIKSICTTLITRPERFAKTAVGWVLRDVSKHDSDFVLQFMHANIEHFSIESARNAMKYMDSKTSQPLVRKIKKSGL